MHHHPTTPPTSAHFYCYFRPPEGEVVLTLLVGRLVQRQPAFQSVSGPGPYRVWGWQVSSWVHSLALSKLDGDTALF
jgi:hypothetical protein